MTDLAREVQNLKKQKAFAWAKYYETLSEDANFAGIIVRAIQPFGIQRDNGELKRPDVLPTHITQELMDMADKLNKKFTCPVCFDLVTKDTIHISWCGHILCKTCFCTIKPNATKVNCPTCRCKI